MTAAVATRPVPASRRRRRGAMWWLAVSSVAIAVVAPLPYLTSTLDRLAADDNTIALNYVDRPGWVQAAFYLHIAFGGIAMLLSPIQLSSRIRRRRPVVHRAAGRVVFVVIVVAALAGATLAPFSEAGRVGFAGFGLLAVAWLASAVAAAVTIRRGDREAHRRWATRTFALTYSAVTLRLWLGVLIPLHLAWGLDGDQAFERSYLIVPFLAWVPNLIVAEWLLRRPATRPARPAVTAYG